MVAENLAPASALARCRERAGDFTAADVARIDEIEKVTRHDVIAFLTFMEERIGPEARFLHFGMTSSDVLDTTLALTLDAAAALLLHGIHELMTVVRARAEEHRATVMMGRTHGIHAEPITFGLKLAIWWDELRRHEERLTAARARIAVGKLSGAVGTFAHVPPSIEAFAMKKLGLTPAPASSQIIQRDRHAEFFSVVALIGASLEKFATEIRHLQRTEVGEVEEPFGQGQKGSSAMPHKRNPVLSENICGLARVLRGYALAAFEDVPLWHERDISHSSVERMIGPDATVTLDFMLHRFTGLMRGLKVYPQRMRENLQRLGGTVNSQRLLLLLAKKGVERQAAYVIIQRNAMAYFDQGVAFQDSLLGDKELRSHLSAEEIASCFDDAALLSRCEEVFQRVFEVQPG